MTFGLRCNVRAVSLDFESEHALRVSEVKIALAFPALHNACKNEVFSVNIHFDKQRNAVAPKCVNVLS